MRFSLPVLCGVNARFRGREKCKVNKKGKSKKKFCRDIKKVEEKKPMKLCRVRSRTFSQ